MSTPRPRPREGVQALPLDDELVLYDPKDAQAHVLNATAAHIWTLCDGARTIEALAHSVAAAYALDYTQVHNDVHGLITSLANAGLLTLDE